MKKLALALVHHPVVDRHGTIVTAAVTNLDLHDVARIARTYGVGKFFVVTPVADQQRLVSRILQHWREGFGAGYHPDRGTALELIEIVATLEAALTAWSSACQAEAVPLLTAAGARNGLNFAEARQRLRRQPLLLTFGTGWGLAPELFSRGWPVLEALRGAGDYNHLPVRAAAAIMLDRLARTEC